VFGVGEPREALAARAVEENDVSAAIRRPPDGDDRAVGGSATVHVEGVVVLRLEAEERRRDDHLAARPNLVVEGCGVVEVAVDGEADLGVGCEAVGGVVAAPWACEPPGQEREGADEEGGAAEERAEEARRGLDASSHQRDAGSWWLRTIEIASSLRSSQ
jgi:hypothetical protein